jgi:ACR3 family arsenite efflux pump ArsB
VHRIGIRRSSDAIAACAALATVAGVLPDVPAMLSVVPLARSTRGWDEHDGAVRRSACARGLRQGA